MTGLRASVARGMSGQRKREIAVDRPGAGLVTHAVTLISRIITGVLLTQREKGRAHRPHRLHGPRQDAFAFALPHFRSADVFPNRM